MFLSRLLEPVKAAAREAGETLWQMYQSGEVQYSHKADDSPVTSADYAANRIIIDRLSELTPDIPIISEESSLVPLAQRQHWPRYWLIDPMDYTVAVSGGDITHQRLPHQLIERASVAPPKRNP